MPPYPLFHPVFDKRKAPARMSHRKIVHPPPKHGVDHLDHPPHGLAGEPSEHIPELRQQRCPLLQLRRIVGPPRSRATENATEFKTQEPFSWGTQETLTLSDR